MATVKLLKLRSETLCAGGSCPAVYETDRGTYVVQGVKIDAEVRAAIQFGDGEDAIELPKEVIIAALGN